MINTSNKVNATVTGRVRSNNWNPVIGRVNREEVIVNKTEKCEWDSRTKGAVPFIYKAAWKNINKLNKHHKSIEQEIIWPPHNSYQ